MFFGILISIIAASNPSPNPAVHRVLQSEWVLIGTWDDNPYFLRDAEENAGVGWVMFGPERCYGETNDSACTSEITAIRYQADCEQQTLRPLAVNTYDLDGEELLDSTRLNRRAESVVEHSMGEQIWSSLCNDISAESLRLSWQQVFEAFSSWNSGINAFFGWVPIWEADDVLLFVREDAFGAEIGWVMYTHRRGSFRRPDETQEDIRDRFVSDIYLEAIDCDGDERAILRRIEYDDTETMVENSRGHAISRSDHDNLASVIDRLLCRGGVDLESVQLFDLSSARDFALTRFSGDQ